MNIAIFTNNYLPNPYGVAGSVESFRKEFEALGHKVFIFAPKWKGYVNSNSNVFWFPSVDIKYKIKFPLAIPFSRRINSILEKLDLDIIHSQHPNLLGSAAMKWARKKEIPIIFTWHTLYDQYAHFVPIIPKKLAAWWAIRNAKNYANRCDWVVTPTRSVVDIIKNWGVTNKNISAIPTGIDEQSFRRADRTSVRKKYGIAEDEIVLILMTRFTKEKNVEFLFKSVIEILKKTRRVKFLACGEGYLKEKLQKIILENKLNDQVIFAGFIPSEIKKNYYSAGDIFVYASKSETQGMILTEAMYSGLPIVAVKAPGFQDIVEDGKTGFLVSEDKKEFSDAVQKLIQDKELRISFSEKAIKLAREKYTSCISARKMLEIYAKTIQNFKSKLLQ